MNNTSSDNYQPGLSTRDVAELAGNQSIVKLSSNENPFGPSPLATSAIHQELKNLNSYPSSNDQELRAALAGFHGQDLTEDNFFSANGGIEVLSILEKAFATSDDRAIVCPPCFGIYMTSLTRQNINIDQVPLKGDEFEIDVEGVLASMKPETRLIYLCNPNNPTGTFFGQETLDSIVDALPANTLLIYDEVYYQYATSAGLPDAIKHVRNNKNIAIVHSFSKAYGLAGLRVGYAIAPSRIIKKVAKKNRSFLLPSLALTGALAAIKDQDHINQSVSNNSTELPKLINALRSMGLKTPQSQGNFVMFKCPNGMLATELTESLVKQGVMVRPAFYLPEHIRVTVGKPNENLRFLAALKNCL